MFWSSWALEIYPGGIADSNEGYVAVYLGNISDSSIKIQYCLSTRDANGEELVHRISIKEFDADGG